ncbi:hypothetical protein FJ364_03900, partial [Candidatus Dependentiae bacterium]|nr:hypothetical protein [Candidatus Dependentiae bacterium]
MRIIFRMIALCFFVTLIEGLEVSVTFPDLPLKKDNQGNEVATAAVGQAFIIAIEMSGAHEATDE